jgi:hypothetical protein
MQVTALQMQLDAGDERSRGGHETQPDAAADHFGERV